DFSEDDKSKIRESSFAIRERIIKAREVQRARFLKDAIFTNAEMKNSHIKKYCNFSKEAKQVLIQAITNFNLSARSYFKMIKVSRTIADLGFSGAIEANHVAEAFQYRSKFYDTP
ncbi:MAG: hypothetical protein PH343_07450, partial [Nitrospira sp.]|nr:hypothetical protein [Nitrospira sp.]